MVSKRSESSLSISSSESLNGFLDENAIFNLKPNESQLNVCFEELKTLANKLKNKTNYLKELEKRLIYKEKSILDFSTTLDHFIKSEIKKNTDNLINEKNQIYSSLDNKYNSLNKDYDRLQNSFQVLKSQNDNLRTKLESVQLSEDTLKKQLNKIKSRLSNLASSRSAPTKCLVDVSTQTQNSLVPTKLGKLNKDTNVDSLLPLVSTMRSTWSKLYYTSLMTILSDSSPGESICDLCLLIIPMSVDHLRSLVNNNTNQNSATRDEMMFHHLEMLHWSFIYLDISRVTIRKTLLNSLAHFGEELVAMLRALSEKSVSKGEKVKTNLETEILISLVALRTVNSANDLSLVVNHIHNLINKFNEALTMFLSKLLFVPLLCRWSSTFNCYGLVSSKVIHLVHQSLDQTAYVCLNTDQVMINGTGLEQFILLATHMPFSSSQSDSTNNYHILSVLLDLLYCSKQSDQELMVEMIEKLILVKYYMYISENIIHCRFRPTRKLLKNLGIISVLTSFISKYSDSNQSQTNPQCLVRLKTILSQLNCDISCR